MGRIHIHSLATPTKQPDREGKQWSPPAIIHSLRQESLRILALALSPFLPVNDIIAFCLLCLG